MQHFSIRPDPLRQNFFNEHVDVFSSRVKVKLALVQVSFNPFKALDDVLG